MSFCGQYELRRCAEPTRRNEAGTAKRAAEYVGLIRLVGFFDSFILFDVLTTHLSHV